MDRNGGVRYRMASYVSLLLCFAERPSIEVGRRDADARERELDLGAMLDAMLGSVDKEKALRIAEAFVLPRQIDVAVLVERFGDGDQLIARLDRELTECVEAWP